MTKRKWSSTGFGDKLKAIREGAGKSQQQLAEAVGVDVMTVSRLERGAQEPAWPLALAIAKALGVGCEAFENNVASNDDDPSDQPAPKLGRPKKPEAPPAPPAEKPAKKGRGKKGGEG